MVEKQWILFYYLLFLNILLNEALTVHSILARSNIENVG